MQEVTCFFLQFLPSKTSSLHLLPSKNVFFFFCKESLPSKTRGLEG